MKKAKLAGGCLTTAMGIMPHTDVDEAIKLALMLDIPFWPQLPKVNYFEDMYVQVSEHFPGVSVDPEERVISFSLDKFYTDFEEYLPHWEEEEFFRLSDDYSVVFHRFLEQDLASYQHIRGQSIGPVSYGLKILDEQKKPMIYYDEVREIIFDFVAKKLKAQYAEMLQVHPGAFVWVDEPGLEMVFMAMTGYPSEKAKEDYEAFLEGLDFPAGVHLCGNPDWSFLLQLNLDVLSLDVLAHGHIFTRYREEIKDFLDRGAIISWGITPTLSEEFAQENLKTMIAAVEKLWQDLDRAGVPYEQLLEQAWFAPARCCLVNLDGSKTVAKSFQMLQEVAGHFKQKL